MNMLDLLRSAQGGNGIENLARQFGLGPEQTESVLKSVLPAVSTGFKQRSRNQGGLAGILKGIQGTDYEDIFDNGTALQRDDVSARGNDILGQIFGSKEVSRGVAQRSQQSSGVGADVIKKMLPVITSMVMGGMQKKASREPQMDNVIGDLLNGLLGSKTPSRPSSGGGLDQILGQILGQQPQTRPAPQPRSGGGLGGILGGLLRGKKPASQPAPQAQQRGGDSLDDMLGSIFGKAPQQRQQTGDPQLDAVIGMFDANGDGEVDMDVLRQLARRR